MIKQWKAKRALAKHVAENRTPASDYKKRSIAARRGHLNSRAKRALEAYHKFCSDPIIKSVCEPTVRPNSEEVRLLKTAVYERDGSGCHYCGKHLQFEQPKLQNYATLEHLTPVMFGGRHEPDNCVLACGPCNQKLGQGGSRIPQMVISTKASLKRTTLAAGFVRRRADG